MRIGDKPQDGSFPLGQGGTSFAAWLNQFKRTHGRDPTPQEVADWQSRNRNDGEGIKWLEKNLESSDPGYLREFNDWKENFVQQNGRDPDPQEISSWLNERPL